MSCALFNSEVEDHLAFASTTGTANGYLTLHVRTSWASGFPIQQVTTHTPHPLPCPSPRRLMCSS